MEKNKAAKDKTMKIQHNKKSYCKNRMTFFLPRFDFLYLMMNCHG